MAWRGVRIWLVKLFLAVVLVVDVTVVSRRRKTNRCSTVRIDNLYIWVPSKRNKINTIRPTC